MRSTRLRQSPKSSKVAAKLGNKIHLAENKTRKRPLFIHYFIIYNQNSASAVVRPLPNVAQPTAKPTQIIAYLHLIVLYHLLATSNPLKILSYSLKFVQNGLQVRRKGLRARFLSLRVCFFIVKL